MAAFVIAPAMADWNHPIKWDQLNPLDSYAGASWIDYDNPSDAQTADDFMCNQTGWITDIHFAGWSYYGETWIDKFRVSFWTDVPQGSDASHPGTKLWEHDFDTWNTTGTLPYYYEIDIPEPYWFLQQQGNIYWISIQGVMVTDGYFDAWYWQFRERHEPTNLDDAAFWSSYFGYAPWASWGFQPGYGPPGLYDGLLPGGWTSADMSFALTGIIPEPASIGLLGLGLFLLRRR